MGSLEITDLALGTGAEALPGTIVAVRYRGTFPDGRAFDASGNDPFRFPLGEGVVIPGWDEGLVGMKVGGKRRLRIPPEFAYGEAGSPPEIPPHSTLVFEVELVGVTREKW